MSEPTMADRCGTYAGAQLHTRRGQSMCDPCREAYNAYHRKRLTDDPEARNRHRADLRAGDQARREIARRYPRLYRRLKAEFLAQMDADA